MGFSITTWNINSVRLRMPIVERLLLELSLIHISEPTRPY